MFHGAIRLGGADQAGAVVSVVASGAVAIAGSIATVAAMRSDDADVLVLLILTLGVVAVLGLGIVAGVSQPIDPRVIATEPLSPRHRAIGLLTAASVGPPGIAGIAIGVAMTIAAADRVATLPLAAAAVASWLISLLLISRSATNALSLLLAKAPRAGQFVAALGGLAFYGLFQILPVIAADMGSAERDDLAAVLRWTPPGQLGAAIAAGSTPAAAAHLVAGSLWLIPLYWGFAASIERLSVAVRSTTNSVGGNAGIVPRLARWLCGSGAEGAVAWRSLLTRFRTPRTALETVTGAGVGLAAVLVPTLVRDDPGSGAVLVGGAVQLAVLFVAGNSFGNDGPAIAYELLTGVPPRVHIAGKARSILIVGAPLAVAGPLIAAALTGGWRYLPAGFGVGVGALFAGVGAALIQSTLVPIAVPDTDNPFASGESGKGMLAALLLVVVLLGLAVATLPAGLALFWATDRGRDDLVMTFAVASVLAGFVVFRLGRAVATRRLTGRDESFIASVTPAR